MTVRRALEFVVVPLLTLAAVVAPAVAWSDRLPAEVAVHFGAGGVPDRGDPLGLFVGLLAGVVVLGWIGFSLPVLRGRVGGGHARALVGAMHGLGGMMGAISVVTLRSSLDVDRWQDAAPLDGATFGLTLLVGVAMGALGATLAAGHPAPDHGSIPVTALPTAPAGVTVWSGIAANHGLAAAVATGFVATGVSAFLVVDAALSGALTGLALASVLLLTLTRIRVTVGPRGLRASLGWFGWPRQVVPIEDVTGVAVEEVVPAAYGGWGYRVVPGARALVVRTGPAIRVERGDRPALVVTVDDAATGAAVLAGHLAATGRAGGE